METIEVDSMSDLVRFVAQYPAPLVIFELSYKTAVWLYNYHTETRSESVLKSGRVKSYYDVGDKLVEGILIHDITDQNVMIFGNGDEVQYRFITEFNWGYIE